MNAHWARRLAPIVYFAIVSSAHLEFSLWLVSTRQSPFGTFAFAQAVPALAGAALVALLLWIARRARENGQPVRVLAAWAGWLACVALVDRFLTYSLNELAHYPEYALLAILIGRAMAPREGAWPAGRILFWTTLLGALDELQQYVWLTPGYGNYFDFNDCLVNLLGGALGLLLARPAGSPAAASPNRSFPRREVATAVALVAVVGAATLSGRLVLTPEREIPPGGFLRGDDGAMRFYLQRAPGQYDARHPGHRHGGYYALGPAVGLVLTVGAGVAFAAIAAGVATPRRSRAGAPA